MMWPAPFLPAACRWHPAAACCGLLLLVSAAAMVTPAFGADEESVGTARPPDPPVQAPSRQEAQARGVVNFFFGRKELDEVPWGEQNSQQEIGAETAWGRATWPILIAVDVFASSDTRAVRSPLFGALFKDTTQSTTEFALGPRRIWRTGPARPYLGGGLAYVRAHQEVTASNGATHHEVAADAGLWAGGGIFWALKRHFNLGLVARYSYADMTLIDVSDPLLSPLQANAGGFHAGVLIGWGWEPAPPVEPSPSGPASPPGGRPAAPASAVPEAPPPPEEDWIGDLNLFVGNKKLDEETWGEQSSQRELGVEGSWGKDSWPVMVASDFFASRDSREIPTVPTGSSSNEATQSTMELGFGVRRIWRVGTARPYLGGGLAFISGHREATPDPALFVVGKQESRALSMGFWAGGGLFWTLGRGLNLGFALRYSHAAAQWAGENKFLNPAPDDSGGLHAGILLGWGSDPKAPSRPSAPASDSPGGSGPGVR